MKLKLLQVYIKKLLCAFVIWCLTTPVFAEPTPEPTPERTPEQTQELSTPGINRMIDAKKYSPGDIGETLINKLNCVACHAHADTTRFKRKQAPDLSGLGLRMNHAGITEYIQNPASTSPGTIMPDVLPADSKQQAELLTQWLFSIDGDLKTYPEDGHAEKGKELYHTIGCAMCHQPIEQEASNALKRYQKPLNLKHIRQKYTWNGLVDLLLHAEQRHPSGGMPNMKLSKEEAIHLAAFMIGTPNRVVTETTPLSKTDTERAKQLFGQNCNQCHVNPAQPKQSLPRPHAKPLQKLNAQAASSCISEKNNPGRKHPYYPLSEEQRKHIQTALARLKADQGELPVKDRLSRRIAELNCTACHQRENLGAPDENKLHFFESSAEDMGDEGRIPPTLSDVGYKLKQSAIKDVLEGKGDIRPYMKTRMPLFSKQHTEGLDSLFHQVDIPADRQPVEVIGRNMYGRQLVGVKGMGCIVCHQFAGKRSLGIQALDITLSPKRLRPEWFREYLINPQKFRPGTRMPSFWPDGKRSQFKHVLGGHAIKQIDAIYVYLMEANQTRLPDGLEKKGIYEQKPGDKPIILRLFMKDVGPHALAVGFPHKVNAAFNTNTNSLVKIWKGRFIDAESAWDNRFQPPTQPLGDDVVTLNTTPLFSTLESQNTAWPNSQTQENHYRAQGYEINKDGTPVISYTYKNIGVKDQLRGEDGVLNRTIQLTATQPKLYARIITGKTIKQLKLNTYLINDKLTITLSANHPTTNPTNPTNQPHPLNPIVRQSNKLQELLIPLQNIKEPQFNIRYEW